MMRFLAQFGPPAATATPQRDAPAPALATAFAGLLDSEVPTEGTSPAVPAAPEEPLDGDTLFAAVAMAMPDTAPLPTGTGPAVQGARGTSGLTMPSPAPSRLAPTSAHADLPEVASAPATPAEALETLHQLSQIAPEAALPKDTDVGDHSGTTEPLPTEDTAPTEALRIEPADRQVSMARAAGQWQRLMRAEAPSAMAEGVDAVETPDESASEPMLEPALETEPAWRTVQQAPRQHVEPAPSGEAQTFTPEPELNAELPEPQLDAELPLPEPEDPVEILRPWETARLDKSKVHLTVDDELSVEVEGDGYEVHVRLEGTEQALDTLRDVGPELRDALAEQGFSLGDMDFSRRDSEPSSEDEDGAPASPDHEDPVDRDGHLVYAIA